MKVLKEILKKYNNEDFVDIYEIVKNYGLEVVEWNFKDIDGILFGNTIGIRKNIDSQNKRFIIAHEFCHFLLKEKSYSTGIYHSLDFIEKRADKFATELLLPKKVFLEKYKEYQNIPTLSEFFGVPEKVVEMRLNNLVTK